MTTQDQAQKDKRAAADAAKQQATDARAAANAEPDNAELKAAADQAEAEATRLEAEANQAPSHEPKPDRTQPTKKERIKKRMDILREQYIAEGGDAADLDDADLQAAATHGADEDKPITRADLARLGIVKTAEQMAGELADAELRQAVLDELPFISKSLPDQQRYDKAIALASSSKNARVAQEARRMGTTTAAQRHAGGGGAPATDDPSNFTPTPQEKIYMQRYKLTKEDILKSRRDAQAFNFGGKE